MSQERHRNMLKRMYKTSLVQEGNFNRAKEPDIVRLYERQLKESSDKQKRILEIQRRAVRKPTKRREEERSRVMPPRRVKRLPYLPPIGNQTITHREQKLRNQIEEEKEDKEDRKKSRMRLPSLAQSRPSKKRVYGERSERGPIFDPRFRGLLSSLITIPIQYGQVQRYAPPKRLSYVSIKD